MQKICTMQTELWHTSWHGPTKIRILLAMHSRVHSTCGFWSLSLLASPCSQAFATPSFYICICIWQILGLAKAGSMQVYHIHALAKQGLSIKPLFATHSYSKQSKLFEVFYHVVLGKHPSLQKHPPPSFVVYKVLRVTVHHAKFLRSELKVRPLSSCR